MILYQSVRSTSLLALLFSFFQIPWSGWSAVYYHPLLSQEPFVCRTISLLLSTLARLWRLITATMSLPNQCLAKQIVNYAIPVYTIYLASYAEVSSELFGLGVWNQKLTNSLRSNILFFVSIAVRFNSAKGYWYFRSYLILCTFDIIVWWWKVNKYITCLINNSCSVLKSLDCLLKTIE